jgi:hypothetical protein
VETRPRGRWLFIAPDTVSDQGWLERVRRNEQPSPP